MTSLAACFETLLNMVVNVLLNFVMCHCIVSVYLLISLDTYCVMPV